MLPGLATDALMSELSSEDPGVGCGAGVPWAGGCGHGNKGQHGGHTEPPFATASTYHLGKQLDFSLVFIPMHQFMTGISLSPIASLPFQLGFPAPTAGRGCAGVCNNLHPDLIPIPDAGDTGTPCAHPCCQHPLWTTLPLPWVMDAQ